MENQAKENQGGEEEQVREKAGEEVRIAPNFGQSQTVSQSTSAFQIILSPGRYRRRRVQLVCGVDDDVLAGGVHLLIGWILV